MAACPACTFINTDDAAACEVCGASLGSAPPTGAQLGSAPPAAAAVKACAPSLGKRTAAHAGSTSSTDLLRLWQGDLVEPLLALLPLKAIATVPAVSRRVPRPAVADVQSDRAADRHHLHDDERAPRRRALDGPGRALVAVRW